MSYYVLSYLLFCVICVISCIRAAIKVDVLLRRKDLIVILFVSTFPLVNVITFLYNMSLLMDDWLEEPLIKSKDE